MRRALYWQPGSEGAAWHQQLARFLRFDMSPVKSEAPSGPTGSQHETWKNLGSFRAAAILLPVLLRMPYRHICIDSDV